MTDYEVFAQCKANAWTMGRENGLQDGASYPIRDQEHAASVIADINDLRFDLSPSDDLSDEEILSGAGCEYGWRFAYEYEEAEEVLSAYRKGYRHGYATAVSQTAGEILSAD